SLLSPPLPPPRSPLFPYTTLFRSQLGRSLLEHAGADAVLDVLAAAIFEDDALDSRDLEQARQGEPGRPRADDPDLGSQNGKGCRSEEHTSELQSRGHLVCRLLLEK